MRVFITGLFLVGLAFPIGCSKAGKGSPTAQIAAPAVPDGSAPDVVSVFTLVGHTETGRKKWEVRGETADLLAETVQLSPVEAFSYGNTMLHLTAQKGLFHRLSQDVYLEKDVVVTTSDGARITTDTFDWKAKTEMGATQDKVTMTRPGMVVVGRGAVGYPKLRRVRLEKQVTVTLEGQEGKEAKEGKEVARGGVTVITCDGPMEVDSRRSKARFWRNVRVKDAKGSIRSDRMDVTLEPGTNRMKRATFWGNVQIHHENQMSTSRRAIYWPRPGRTILAGHPRLVMLTEEERVW